MVGRAARNAAARGHGQCFFREGVAGIELGWNTYREFRGKGFASETAAEALRHAFEVRGEQQAKALISAGNAASIGVAQHLDLHYDGATELYAKPIDRYVVQRTP